MYSIHFICFVSVGNTVRDSVPGSRKARKSR